jgi:hypothetical protein
VLGEVDLGDPLGFGLVVVVLVAVDKENEVRVLFERVVQDDVVSDEAMQAFDGQVVDILLAIAFN